MLRGVLTSRTAGGGGGEGGGGRTLSLPTAQQTGQVLKTHRGNTDTLVEHVLHAVIKCQLLSVIG